MDKPGQNSGPVIPFDRAKRYSENGSAGKIQGSRLWAERERCGVGRCFCGNAQTIRLAPRKKI